MRNTRSSRRISRRAKPRPKAWAIAAVLLLGAGGLGAWMATEAPSLQHAELTSRLVAPPARAPAPPPPPELQAKLEDIVAAYKEPVGVAVTDVNEHWTAQVDGSSAYPQQSVVKVWVALAVMEAIDRGRLKLDQTVVLRPEDRSVFYQPLGARIGARGYATTIEDLLRRALTESDNTANDKLMEEVGGAGAVSAVLARKGVIGIGVGGPERVLQARTAGLEWRPELAGWRFKEARAKLPDEVRDRALEAYLADPPDGARPAALAEALAALKRGELLSRSSTETLLGLMGEARTGYSRLRAGLPAGWSIAHKTGTGPDWRGASVGINDVGLVTAPDGRSYAVAVMMRETKQPVPRRLALMQKVSRTVVDYWRTHQQDGPAQTVAGRGAPAGKS
ncbi:MAG: beta-lactamase [Phenylobacterium sp.]|nr:beta-lactamase [Phenylobacterium sp.]